MTDHIDIAELRRRTKALKPRTTHAAETKAPAAETEQDPKHCANTACRKRVLADAGFRETARGITRTWCDAACKEEDPG